MRMSSFVDWKKKRRKGCNLAKKNNRIKKKEKKILNFNYLMKFLKLVKEKRRENISIFFSDVVIMVSVWVSGLL